MKKTFFRLGLVLLALCLLMSHMAAAAKKKPALPRVMVEPFALEAAAALRDAAAEQDLAYEYLVFHLIGLGKADIIDYDVVRVAEMTGQAKIPAPDYCVRGGLAALRVLPGPERKIEAVLSASLVRGTDGTESAAFSAEAVSDPAPPKPGDSPEEARKRLLAKAAEAVMLAAEQLAGKISAAL